MTGDNKRPLSVSVVIETVNEEAEPQIDLSEVLQALDRQTYPKASLEIVVVVARDNGALAERLRVEHPSLTVVLSDDPHYYPMKTAGARKASGEVIVFLDSDTVPTSRWAEHVVTTIEAGADVVAGKTRYPQGVAFRRTFDFFNFGHIHNDGAGQAIGFLPNNFAIRAKLLRQHPFDPRVRRSGGAVLLSKQLRALGYSLVYEPAVLVTHNSYAPLKNLLMRVKSGFDLVNLSQLDGDGVVQEARFVKRTPLGLARVFARRVAFDMRLLTKHRHDLGLSAVHVPYFLLISPAIRSLEIGAALLTLARPDYLPKKFNW